MWFRIKLYKIKKKTFNYLKERILDRLNEKSIFIAKLYYFFLDPSFNREMLSVLMGKKIHENRNANNEANDAFLRRAIHRIEKGLIVPNGKKVFAIDYIYKTCQVLTATYNRLDEKSKKWVIGVLNKYFETVDDTIEIIKISKNHYNAFKHKFFIETETESQSIPFHYKTLKAANVRYDDFLYLAQKRHSVRYFKDVIVEKKCVEKALSIGLQSPSACNRQPFEVIVVHDKHKIDRVVNLPMGMKTYKESVKNIAIVVGDLSSYSEERDRHVIYIDGGLFVMSFVYGLEVQGLSSCIINWPDIEVLEENFYKEFKIPNYKRCICFIAFGYADEDGMIPYSEKKAVSDILSYNEYSNR